MKSKFREFEEREEYLAWQTAIVCKLWLDGKTAEAMFLSESLRRFISRIIPNPSEFERGLYLFNEGLVLVSGIYGREAIGDYVWVTEREEDFPTPAWPLIIEREEGGKYLVRLILRRCGMCGHDTCECYSPDDCDRVEIQNEVIGDRLTAFRELCRLYLSWFFSERALMAGIRPRTEVNEAYFQMRRELMGLPADLTEEERKVIAELWKSPKMSPEEIRKELVSIIEGKAVGEMLLTPIKPKSQAEKKTEREKLRRRKAEHQRAVEKTLEAVAKFYEEEIPKLLEKEKAEFEEKTGRKRLLRGVLPEKEELTEWDLWDCVSDLDIAFSDVSRLLEKAKKEREHAETAKLLAQAKEHLDRAMYHLVPEEDAWEWKHERRFGNVTSDQGRLRTALEELRKVNDILYNNRRVIGLAEVKRGASRHSFWFEADLKKMARAIWGLEKYLAMVEKAREVREET